MSGTSETSAAGATVRVRQWRGDCVESEHPVSVVAMRDGQVLFAEGPDTVTAFRSASKPFQLAVSLSHLGDPSDLTAQELAVGSASHSAEPQHLAVVRRILERFGCAAGDLRCGAHPPMHAPSAAELVRAGAPFTDLHNNCSGKHSFMLAAAARRSWDLDYRAPEHPLQRSMHAQLTAWMDHAPSMVVDGCGVPTFVQPLSRAARLWAELASAMHERDARGAADPWQARLRRIGWAMAEHPELTSGTGRLDLDVVRFAAEPLAVKVGAAGLFCIAHPRTRTGVAVKVHSGVAEALPVAVEWALSRLSPGLFARPPQWEHALVRNVVGREVGRWTCD